MPVVDDARWHQLHAGCGILRCTPELDVDMYDGQVDIAGFSGAGVS